MNGSIPLVPATVQVPLPSPFKQTDLCTPSNIPSQEACGDVVLVLKLLTRSLEGGMPRQRGRTKIVMRASRVVVGIHPPLHRRLAPPAVAAKRAEEGTEVEDGEEVPLADGNTEEAESGAALPAPTAVLVAAQGRADRRLPLHRVTSVAIAGVTVAAAAALIRAARIVFLQRSSLRSRMTTVVAGTKKMKLPRKNWYPL